MSPPADGHLNTISVNRRTYSATPGSYASISDNDVAAVTAAGWAVYNGSVPATPAAPIFMGETLRRREAAARNNNPLSRPPLIGSKPWVVLTGAWPASTAVAVGALYSNGGNVYQVISPGTTAASGGPTGTNPTADLTDGTAHWAYYGYAIGDQVSNGGWVFEVTTAGLPATTGTGPTPASLTDGTITWALVGKQTAPVVTTSNATDAALTKLYATTALPSPLDGGGVWRYAGGVPTVKNSAGIGLPSVNVYPASGNFVNAGVLNTNTILQRGTTLCEDSKLELKFTYATGGAFRLIVDGQYVSMTPIVIGNGFPGYIKLDWTNAGGRKRREVTYEFASGILAGARVNPTGSLSYPAETDNFSVAHIGDSRTTATGATYSGIDSTHALFTHLAGLPDATIIGIGGTGVIAPSTSTPYIGHVPDDLARLHAFRPLGLIVLESTSNDAASTLTEIRAAVTALLQAIRAVYPTVPIIVTGWACPNTFGANLTLWTDIENTWKAAVTAQIATGDKNIRWIPGVSDQNGPWIYGTGKVGATTGDGNADICGAADGSHLTSVGYALWARRQAAAYRAAIADLP
jgi:lysophospholipase L1-like esterase